MQLIVDGRDLSLSGVRWGDEEWSLCWPGYSDELTFDVDRTPSWMRPGMVTSLVWGGETLFTGTLDEPTRGEKLRAAGLHRLGDTEPALDTLGAMSLIPHTVLDAVADIATALPWVYDGTATTDAMPLSEDNPATVAQVMDAWMDLSGYSWGVLPSGLVHWQTRSTPRLHVRPGGDGIGIAWDNYASELVARYNDSGSGIYETATRTDSTAEDRWGRRRTIVPGSLNDGAPMTSTQAEAILDSMLDKGRARPGWTTPLEVEYGGVTTDRGQPVDLRTIKPYETIRVHGLNDDIGDLAGRTWVDMPLARIDPKHGGQVAVLTPEGLVSPMTDVLSGKNQS